MWYHQSAIDQAFPILERIRRLRALRDEGRDMVKRSQHLLAHVARLDKPGGRFANVTRYQLRQQAVGIVQADRAGAKLACIPMPFSTRWVGA